MLQSLPCDFQQEPLLRVHALGLARANGKERGVKLVNISQECAKARSLRRCGVRIVRVVECSGIPAIDGHFTDGVHAVAQQLPEGVGVHCAARETQPHADNGNGCMLLLLQRGHACAQAADFQQRALDGRKLQWVR